MTASANIIQDEINYLSKRFEHSRGVIIQTSLMPHQRKEPPVFSARRAAEILQKSASSVNSTFREFAGEDAEPGLNNRHEVNQAMLTRLMDHYYGEPTRPGRAKVVVVENQKGGVGKTTTMVHLAPWLALHRYKVLAIDADPQASFTTYQGLNPDAELEESDTISYILSDETNDDGEPATLKSIIRKSPHIDNLYYVPSCLDLYNGDIGAYRKQFQSMEGGGYRFFNRLKTAIDEVRDDYDIILIDCPPHISAITYNAVYAADMMIVPLGPHMLDLASTGRFVEWMKIIVTDLPGCELSKIRFMITNYDGGGVGSDEGASRTASAENVEVIRTTLGVHLLNAMAMHSSEIQRAGALLKSIYEVPSPIGSRDAWSRACKSMDVVNRELTNEIVKLWHAPGITTNKTGSRRS